MSSSSSSSKLPSRLSRYVYDDESDDDDELLSYQPFSSQRANRIVVPPPAAETQEPVIQTIERTPEQKAETKVKHWEVPSGIAGPQDLFWRVERKKKKIMLYPCRICRPFEATGLALKQEWDNTKEALVQFLARNEKGRRKHYKRSTLVPFYNKSDDKTVWCPEYLEMYEKQLRKNKKNDEITVLVEMKILQKVLQHAKDQERKAEEEEKQRQQEMLEMQQQQKLGDENHRNLMDETEEDDDNQEEFLKLGLESRKTGFLCAGDVIEYVSPCFTAGNKLGYRRATILSVDPRHKDSKLVLDNGEFLPHDTKVKRVSYRYRGNIKKNPDACFREIQGYKLRKSGGNHNLAAGIQREGERYGEILNRRQEEYVAKARQIGAPIDTMRKFKGTKSARVTKEERGDGPECAGSMDTTAFSRGDTVPGAKKASVPIEDLQKRKLEERIAHLKEAGKRRGGASHMTLGQLQLALDVINTLLAEYKGVDEYEAGVEALAKQLDISEPGLKLFLQGDENKAVGKAQHSETETELGKWMEAKSREVVQDHVAIPVTILEDEEEVPCVQFDGEERSEARARGATGVASKAQPIDIGLECTSCDEATAEEDNSVDAAVKPKPKKGKASAKPKLGQSKRRVATSKVALKDKLGSVGSTAGPSEDPKRRMEQRISQLKSQKRQRTHMTLVQLQLALEVRSMLELKWKTADDYRVGIDALAEELDISLRGLELFLDGDEKNQVGTAQHEETFEKLQEWKASQLACCKHDESDEEPPFVTQEYEESSGDENVSVSYGTEPSTTIVTIKEVSPECKSQSKRPREESSLKSSGKKQRKSSRNETSSSVVNDDYDRH